MQAMRIHAVARAHPGDTVVVVIGAMHKVDIERILAGDPAVHIVQPSAILTLPDSAAASRALTTQDRFAIAAVNVLGVQAQSGPVDWPWAEAIVEDLARELSARPDVRLIQIQLALLRHRVTPQTAVQKFEAIGRDSAAAVPLFWNGVQDLRRIDSYFDPFGNLTVQQRALVEAARVEASLGASSQVKALHAALLATQHWTPLEQGELDVYWTRYVAP